MVEYPITDRLRCSYNGRDFSGPGPAGMMLPTAIMKEAADEIERLIAEVERLSAQSKDAERRTFRYGEESKALKERAEKAEAERDSYKAALEKIVGANWSGHCKDGYTVGHVAMEALSEVK